MCKKLCTLFSFWVAYLKIDSDGTPTPVLSPGESNGQRSLAGYSPRGPKESDTTERLSLSGRIDR